MVPGQHELAQSLPWGGTSHPVWFRRDPRVANVKAQGGVFNAALMHGVPQIVAGALEATKDMSPEDRDAALTETARQVMNVMPPRENPPGQQISRLGARVGPAEPRALRDPRQQQLQTDGSAAGVRGSLAAPAAAEAVRFASGCQAFGHHELLGVLRSFGLVAKPVLTVQD